MLNTEYDQKISEGLCRLQLVSDNLAFICQFELKCYKVSKDIVSDNGTNLKCSLQFQSILLLLCLSNSIDAVIKSFDKIFNVNLSKQTFVDM